MDAFFGATAQAYDLPLATRNVRGFDGLDITLFNPWDTDQSA